MRIETLRTRFRSQGERTKLYIADYPVLLAGYTSNPRPDGEALVVDICPYVSYSFENNEIVAGDRFAGVRLHAGSIFSRQPETHERQALREHEPQDLARLREYFARARLL